MRRRAFTRAYRGPWRPGFGQEPEPESLEEQVVEAEVMPRTWAIVAGVVSGIILVGTTAYAVWDWWKRG